MLTSLQRNLTLAVVALTGAANAADLTATWQARYEPYVKTLTSRNWEAFQGYVSPQFYWITADGKKLDRKAALAQVKPLFEGKSLKGGEKILKVVQRGDEVDVSVLVSFTAVPIKGKPFAFTENGTDTWKKIAGKWHLIKSVDAPVKKK